MDSSWFDILHEFVLFDQPWINDQLPIIYSTFFLIIITSRSPSISTIRACSHIYDTTMSYLVFPAHNLSIHPNPSWYPYFVSNHTNRSKKSLKPPSYISLFFITSSLLMIFSTFTLITIAIVMASLPIIIYQLDFLRPLIDNIAIGYSDHNIILLLSL